MSSTSRIDESIEGSRPWLFLSPHLDDAVLSCGALLEASVAKRQVTVATVFTESGPAPYTRAARSFLRQCVAADARSLFEARRAEDVSVLGGAGVGAVHLGETDALFRRRREPRIGRPLWCRLTPEFVHRYPTYRFDIARGKISRGDKTLISQLQQTVAELLEHTGAQLLFCPAGVGRHVDHLITRMAGEGFRDKVIFYSDFPYNQGSAPDARFLRCHGLETWTWNEAIAEKHRLIRGYATQAEALFPDGKIPEVPEIYYIPRSRGPAERS